ncbi:MAG: hypothetical protein Q4C50_11170 [Eubacteriales bacterium]|nr:hypothetical protein [Eubacteriales bacterium]
MDLLDFGMKNEQSDSRIRRTLARAAIAAEKKKADLYEAALNKKDIPLPDDPEGDAAMLQKIKEAIAEQNAE